MLSQRSLGLLVGLGVLLGGGTTLAQSFNFEINSDAVAGSWNGAPAETNGCAAELPGKWNKVPVQASYTGLIDVNGNPTNIDISLYGPDISGPYSADIPGMTGDFDRLFADGMTSVTGHPLQFSIVNLKPGFYTVVTYAPNPYNVITTNVNVPESNEGAKLMPGGISGNAFVEGKTHVTHHAFTSDGHLVIYVFSPTSSYVNVAGFQIRYLGGVYPKLYVNASASAGFSGSSWVTSLRSLEDAMNIAQFSNTVTQIFKVADGFYAPTTGTDRTKTFNLRSNLAIYGSFQESRRRSPNGTSRSRRRSSPATSLPPRPTTRRTSSPRPASTAPRSLTGLPSPTGTPTATPTRAGAGSPSTTPARPSATASSTTTTAPTAAR